MPGTRSTSNSLEVNLSEKIPEDDMDRLITEIGRPMTEKYPGDRFRKGESLDEILHLHGY